MADTGYHTFRIVDMVIKKAKTDRVTSLQGAEFKITSLDGKQILDAEQTYQDGLYHLENIVSGQHIGRGRSWDYVKFLPKNIQDFIGGLKTRADVEAFAPVISASGECTACRTNLNGFSSYATYGGATTSESFVSSLRVPMSIPLVLREVKSPAGFQKTDSIVIANTNVYFHFGADSDEISNMSVDIPMVEDGIYAYNPDIDYDNIVTSPDSLSILENDALPSQEDYVIVVDEEGDVVFETDNTVNGERQVQASKNAKLSVKTTVINSGNASSGNNVITASIPDGLDVDVRSIRKGGKYDEDANTITWTSPYIDPDSKTEFSYNIIVPEEIEDGTYVLSSTAKSDQTPAQIETNDLVLTIGTEATPPYEDTASTEVANNPATGDLFTAIATVVIACTFVGACLFRKLKHVR